MHFSRAARVLESLPLCMYLAANGLGLQLSFIVQELAVAVIGGGLLLLQHLNPGCRITCKWHAQLPSSEKAALYETSCAGAGLSRTSQKTFYAVLSPLTRHLVGSSSELSWQVLSYP